MDLLQKLQTLDAIEFGAMTLQFIFVGLIVFYIVRFVFSLLKKA